MKKYDMINKYKLTLLSTSIFVVATMFFSGCWKSETKDKSSNLVVINVLDKDYYDDCHITGSINIPFEDVETHMKNMDKKKHYVFYCSNYACTAAPFSAKMLKDAEFEHVFVYHGGIVEWYQHKYPYTGPAEKSYLQDSNDKLDMDEPLNGQDHDAIIDINAEKLLSMMKDAKLLS